MKFVLSRLCVLVIGAFSLGVCLANTKPKSPATETLTAQEHPTADEATLAQQQEERIADTKANTDMTIAFLHKEITKKATSIPEQVDFYDKRRNDILKELDMLRADVRTLKLKLASHDSSNLFALSSACQEAFDLTADYQNRLDSIFSFAIANDLLDTGYKRISEILSTLSSYKNDDLSEISNTKKKEIEDSCKKLLKSIIKFRARVTVDMKSKSGLDEEMAKLAQEAEEKTTYLKERIFSSRTNVLDIIHKWQLNEKILKDAYESTYSLSNEEESNRRGDIYYIISAFMVCIAIAFILTKILFMDGNRFLKAKGLITKLLMQRQTYDKRPYYMLTLFLLFMALGLRCFEVFHELTFMKNLDILGPEITVTIALIVLSVTMRLPYHMIWTGLRVYLPIVISCTIFIVLRLTTAREIILQLLLPVLLAAMCIYTLYHLLHKGKILPHLDKSLGFSTVLLTLVGAVLAWEGLPFFAFLLILGWNVMCTGILFLTALWMIVKNHYDKKKEKHKDVPIWQRPLYARLIIPLLSVWLLWFSFYWPAGVFDMTTSLSQAINRPLTSLRDNPQKTQSVDISATTTTISGTTRAVLPPSVNAEDASQKSTGMFPTLTIKDFIIVIILGISLNYLIFVGRSILHTVYGDKYEAGAIPTIVTLSSLVIWAIYTFVALAIMGANFTGLFVVMGGLGVGLGLAMKDTIENLMSGLSLMLGRLRQGDIVECDGIRGKVAHIGYKTTFLETLDGSMIGFPNTQLFNKNFRNLTINHKYENVRIDVGVAYGTDIDEAKQIILNVVKHIDVLSKSRNPSVLLSEFGDNAVNLAVFVWVPVRSKGATLSLVREEIYKAFNQHGISIPFPQRDVYIKSMSTEETGKTITPYIPLDEPQN